MTRTRLSIAMMILFAPAVALAHGGGGNGNGNGGVGGGMGGGHGNVGVGSMNGMGHGNFGGTDRMSGSGRMVDDRGPSADSDFGSLANAREDFREEARERAAIRARLNASSDTHGKAVSSEAHLAKSENDGDKVGADVRATAHDRSTLKTHTRTHGRLARTTTQTSTHTHPVNHGAAVSAEAHLARSQHSGGIGKDVSAVAHERSTLPTHASTKVASTTSTMTSTKVASKDADADIDASTKTHPVNHGAAVSAEAHLAKSENDGDKVGEDVRAVAHDRSTLPTHATTSTKTGTKVAGKDIDVDTDTSTKTSTKTHPVNHGAAVSAEAHLAKSENDGDKVGEDVRAVAHDKSTLPTHASTMTKIASTTSTKTHPVNHGGTVSAEAHLAKTENDGDKVGEDVSAVAKTNSQTHK